MAFRKFKSDRLFDGYRFLPESKVLVANTDGTIEDIIDSADAGEDILQLSGMLVPGFINCHCHLELSHLLNKIPERSGLVDFVVAVMQHRHEEIDIIMDAIIRAEQQMIGNGIVAVGDICNTAHTVPQKNKNRLYYHNFIEASGVTDGVAEQRFKQILEVYSEFAKTNQVPALSNSIVPHSPYSVSGRLWQLMLKFPGNRLLTMHNQESESENEWFVNKDGDFLRLFEKLNIDTSLFKPSGKSSLQTVLLRFLKNQSIILVHNVATREEDIVFTKDHADITWCLCPGANKYISGLYPPLELFQKHECRIVIGTDSLASNHQLSILAEIELLQQQFPWLQPETTLQWATINGARALHIDDIFGSFEKGKKPGLVLIKDGECERIL